MIREGRVFISNPPGDPDFGSNYYVTAYEVGAQVTSGSSGTTATVRAGHGFAALDKFIVFSSGSYLTNSYNTVSAVGATTLTITAAPLSAGDILVNLGQDTGIASPNYVDVRGAGFPTAVYTDMDYSTFATNSTVQTDANGRYRFYHQGIAFWELVRTPTGTPFAVFQSGSQSTVEGPSNQTTTNNAVALWDGTDGTTLKNSVVIANTGAITGVTTLATSGAATIGGALAITGALSGATTIGASGALTCAGATISGTSALGTVTVSSTLAVTSTSTLTGAVTLTGGVAGAMTATGNVTSGGHIRGAKATVALTGNTALVTTDRILLDITNTSGTNTGCTLTAPSSQDGQILVLRIAAITAGSFSLIESTTAALEGTEWTTPGAGDTLTLIASGSLWYELARKNN